MHVSLVQSHHYDCTWLKEKARCVQGSIVTLPGCLTCSIIIFSACVMAGSCTGVIVTLLGSGGTGWITSFQGRFGKLATKSGQPFPTLGAWHLHLELRRYGKDSCPQPCPLRIPASVPLAGKATAGWCGGCQTCLSQDRGVGGGPPPKAVHPAACCGASVLGLAHLFRPQGAVFVHQPMRVAF